MRRFPVPWLPLLLAVLLPAVPALADDPPPEIDSAEADAFLASIEPSPELQEALDVTVRDLRTGDARLRKQEGSQREQLARLFKAKAAEREIERLLLVSTQPPPSPPAPQVRSYYLSIYLF